MTPTTLIVSTLLALLAGAAVAWLIAQARSRALLAVEQTRNAHLQQQLAEQQKLTQQRDADLAAQARSLGEQQVRVAELQTQLAEERRQGQERLASFEEARHKLEESFKALSADALQASQEAFMRLAGATFEKLQAQTDGKLEQREQAVKALVEPISKSLDGVRTKIDELEKSRAEAYGSLSAQVRSMIVTQDQLRLEAGNLVKALRAPQTRGRWGEIQLKRVVEMAGMLDYCDFEQQVSMTTDDGRLRPDLVVRLPGGKRVVVDAKAPLQA